jgi:TPR repeat protein
LKHPDAALALAVHYHENLDFEQAAAYYAQAAQLGSPEASAGSEAIRQVWGIG